MRKPKAICVLGSWIAIEFVDELEVWGYYSHDERKIRLLNSGTWWHVLLHELTHAYFHVAGYNEIISDQFQESIARLLENMAGITTLTKGAGIKY